MLEFDLCSRKYYIIFFTTSLVLNPDNLLAPKPKIRTFHQSFFPSPMSFTTSRDALEQTAIESAGTPDDSRMYEPRTVEEQQLLDRRFVGALLDQRLKKTGTVSLGTAEKPAEEL